MRFCHEGLLLTVGIHSVVGESILDMMRSSVAACETADALAVQADERPLGLNELEMDSEKHSTGPHLTADMGSTSGMESVEYVDFNHVYYWSKSVNEGICLLRHLISKCPYQRG